MRRPVGRILLAVVFALLAIGAWVQLYLNFRGDVDSREIVVFQSFIAVIATAAAVGSWTMARWAPIAALLYGAVSAALVASLTRLLGLDASAASGLRIGALVVFAFGILSAWYLWRSPRPRATTEHGAVRADMASRSGEPHLEFGFRGEDITYHDGDKLVEISFTYMKGPRIYTDSIERWNDGAALTDDERREVLGRAVAFVRRHRERPVVVVNTDDPFAARWMSICEELRGEIDSVKTDSDAEHRAYLKKMLMTSLAAGKGVIVDGTRLSTEEEIDRHVEQVYPPRSAGTPD